MAEGKKQSDKQGRGSRSASSKMQVQRTAQTKSRNCAKNPNGCGVFELSQYRPKNRQKQKFLTGMPKSFVESWDRLEQRAKRRAEFRKDRVARRDTPEFFKQLFAQMNERILNEAKVNPRDARMAELAIAKQNARRAFVRSMKKV